MTREEVKREVQAYIKVLETAYSDTISKLKLDLAKAKKMTKNEQSKTVAKKAEKSEMEQLFVSCVEDTRREVMKRRLKAEVITR
jgi:hypothetical protein